MGSRFGKRFLRLRHALGLAALVYVIIAWICFTGPLQPIFLYLRGGERLDWMYWEASAVFAGMLGLVVIAILMAIAGRKLNLLFPAVFVLVFLPATVLSAAFLLERERARVIGRFAPDRLIVSSLWQSLHEAPADYQFFLHAAALKDCRPFAWSYRSMRFYPLPPNAAVNVLPYDWLEDCGIVRTQ